ncbi:B3 domain-containing transcription factor VRN1-like isoform X2 [Syzygium oleosum]|uniref:B3 domain-containing transcription factor VRN1-like isoform X2 n=1 Tax=Syzygium oleosum TaxID=219896 RepID=UPI0024BA259F|nr:B3 domain-containing transcription factor VRN1-like isoform X2 [Syzygium oleosum]
MSQGEVRVAASGRRACIFYRLMVDSLIHEKQLGIPKKFARKYGDELSDIVRLVASDSSIWLVELRKHNRRLWFHDGWQRFLEHHSIHSGQFLIFKYEGDSTFHVYIYNLTASWEKNSLNPLGSKEFISSKQFATHRKKNQDIGDVVEIRDLCCACPICSCSKDKCFHEYRGQRMTNRIHVGVNIIKPEPKTDWEVFHRDKGVQVDGVELQSTFDGVGIDWLSQRNRYLKRRKQINESNESEPSVLRKNGDELPPVKSSYGKSSREWNAAITEARGMAIRASHMYEPNNPFFRVIMRPSYVREKFLVLFFPPHEQNLPTSFVGMHLKGDSRDITLQVSDGKKWRVRCLLFDGKGKISRGWREFVADNKLEIGDVCIFEMVRREDIVLKVTIFRVPEIGLGPTVAASYSVGSSSGKLMFNSSQESAECLSF